MYTHTHVRTYIHTYMHTCIHTFSSIHHKSRIHVVEWCAALCDSLDAAARWVAQDISMVGVEAFNTEGVRPSDHFGLMVDIVQQAKDVDEVLRR